MKKTLSILLSIIMLLGVVSVCASAADRTVYEGIGGPAFTEDAKDFEICPGKPIVVADNMPAYDEGSYTVTAAYAEVKGLFDKEFAPYTAGTKLDETFNGASVRYVLEFSDGITEYIVYSSEAVLTVDHKGCGEFFNDKDSHWRICENCGEKCEVGYHTIEDGICSVCGAEDQYKTLKNVFNTLAGIEFLAPIFEAIQSVIQLIAGLLAG